MTLQMFSICDLVTKAYFQPFFMEHKEDAIRAMTALTNDPNQKFYHHPSDYYLYHVGSFDSSTGLVTPFDVAQPVVAALSVKLSNTEIADKIIKQISDSIPVDCLKNENVMPIISQIVSSHIH